MSSFAGVAIGFLRHALWRSLGAVTVVLSCSQGWLPAQDTLGIQDTFTSRHIVAALSGARPLPSGKLLSSRWTPEERKLSRAFLRRVFATQGLHLRDHPYRMPNLYGFQDLLLGPFRGVNLYGVVPAQKPSAEYVLLGAHYDTEKGAPGANDNAAAIAVIHQVVARLVSVRRRQRNLLVVFFDQEEEENVGSRAFIRLCRQQEWRLTSVHTIDQMGWDADGDRAVEIELPTEEMLRLYQRTGQSLGVSVFPTGVSASDHQAFREAGYPAVGITEEFVNGDTSPYKDTPQDTYATVNFTYIDSSAELLFRVFRQLLTVADDE